MSKPPTLQSIAQELALFQMNTLKRLDELQKDKMNADVFTEKVYPLLDMRIKELEDALKISKRNQKTFNNIFRDDLNEVIVATQGTGKQDGAGKPSFFARWFKRKK